MPQSLVHVNNLQDIFWSREGLAIFLVVALNAFRINIVGMLPLGEVFTLLLLPFLWKGWIWRRKEVQMVMLALVGMLCFQISSDLLNSSAFEDYVRGWAGLALLTTNFLFFAMLFYKRPSVIVIYYLAMIVYGFFGRRYDLTVESHKYFGFMIAPMVTPVVILLGLYLYRKSHYWTVLLFASYAFFSFSQNSRALALCFLVPSLMMILNSNGVLSDKIRLTLLTLPLLLVLYAGYCCYVYAVIEKDFSSDNSRLQLAACDNPYNPFELLINGRTDAFLPFYAIKEKPFMGYGSWAKDKKGFNFKKAELSDKTFSFEALRKQVFIDCHSAFTGVWLWSGLGGFISFLALCGIFFKNIWQIISAKPCRYEPIILFMFVSVIWHVLFSPVVHFRWYMPQYTAFVLAIVFNNKLRDNCHVSKNNI